MPLVAGEEEDRDNAEDNQETPHAREALSEGQLRVTVVDARCRVDRQAEGELSLRVEDVSWYLLEVICNPLAPKIVSMPPK